MREIAGMRGLVALTAAVLSVVLLLGPGQVHATSIQFDFTGTPSCGSCNPLPVSVAATFVTLTGEVQISLVNNTVNPTSVIQNLSDLVFVLSTGQTSGTLSPSSGSSGIARTVASNGTFTDGGTVAAGWVPSSTGTGLKLDDLAAGGAGPQHTLIGLPNGSNVYSNANGSIAGNGPHNPFLFGPVTFDLLVPGVTADSSISSVTFSFGTDSTDLGLAPGAPVPEPTTLLLFGTTAVALGAAARKKLHLK